ncbi:MAG: hypothetical protein ACKOPG_04225 [Novosphingobium sp.]
MLGERRALKENALARHFAIALMAATYLAFSARTLLNTVDPGEMFSLKRMIATGVGAIVFMVVARSAWRNPDRPLLFQLSSVLLLSALGAAAILAIRIGYDLYVANRSEGVIQHNLRWLITWLGYFLTAIASYFAVLLARRVARLRSVDRPFTRPEIADALIEEVSQWSPAERNALIASLAQTANYGEADPIEFLRKTNRI